MATTACCMSRSHGTTTQPHKLPQPPTDSPASLADREPCSTGRSWLPATVRDPRSFPATFSVSPAHLCGGIIECCQSGCSRGGGAVAPGGLGLGEPGGCATHPRDAIMGLAHFHKSYPRDDAWVIKSCTLDEMSCFHLRGGGDPFTALGSPDGPWMMKY